MKVKNVRPGILIIADAGLKLAPGESRDIEEPTPQTKQALDDGLLAQVDGVSGTKTKPKTANRTPVGKAEAEGESTPAGNGNADHDGGRTGSPDTAGEQSDDGKQPDAGKRTSSAKAKQPVEAESGTE